MDPNTIEQLKHALKEEHEKLVSELKSIAKPDPRMAGDWDAIFPQMGASQTGSHSSVDEHADEIEEYEVRLEAEHTLESRLLNVNKALERMQKGTYGVCTSCKKEIPPERLHANPAAEHHVEHAK